MASLFKKRLHLRFLGVETGEDAVQIALQFVGGLRGFVNLCLGAFCAGRPAAFLPACRTTSILCRANSARWIAERVIAACECIKSSLACCSGEPSPCSIKAGYKSSRTEEHTSELQ